MAQEKFPGVPWQRSIQTKIAVTIIVVTTVVLGGFAIYNLHRTKDALNGDLRQLAQTTVKRLTKHVEGPLWALNKEQVVSSIKAAMLDKRVQAVVVRGESGNSIYVGRKRDSQGELVPVGNDKSLQENLVKSSMRIFHSTDFNGKERIGTLEVYINPGFVNQRYAAAEANELKRVIIVDLVLVVATLLLLRYLLVAPLTRLTESAETISRGDMDMRINVRSRDEIGLLADALSKLQISLKIAMDRMRRGRES